MALIALSVAYWLISPLWKIKHVEDPIPVSRSSKLESGLSTPIATVDSEAQRKSELSGTFINGAHDVSGSVRVIDTGSQRVLRFENFKTLNGPDLYIYLATDKTAKDYIKVGPIKGTEGNINYDVPPNTDLNKYNHVLVWCKAFSVLFGEAELK